MSDLVKNIAQQKSIEQWNLMAFSAFMNELNKKTAKALFCISVNTENRIELVFAEGITIDQVKELCRQITSELERLPRDGSGKPTLKLFN